MKRKSMNAAVVGSVFYRGQLRTISLLLERYRAADWTSTILYANKTISIYNTLLLYSASQQIEVEASRLYLPAVRWPMMNRWTQRENQVVLG
jgi:hypothetical protein